MKSEYKTNVASLAEAVADFEKKLPGFWWSIGMCHYGAHASCGIDRDGSKKELLTKIIYDEGFHVDTTGGTVVEALQDVMKQALEQLERDGL